MTTHWFCADLHFGHETVATLRGFDDTDSHDKAVMDGLYSTVGTGGVLWILGDVTMGGKAKEAAAFEALKRFAGERQATLHLVLGNHDRAHPLHSGSTGAEKIARQCMDTVGTSRRIKTVDGGHALLSHFPYTGDHTNAARYIQWRLPDEGVPLIHGHTHSTEKISRSEAGTLQVCVSLDAWDLRPASKHEVVDLLVANSAPDADLEEVG